MKEWEPIDTAPKEKGDIIVVRGGTYGCEYNPLEFYNAPLDGECLVYWDGDWKTFRNGLYHYYPEMWRWPEEGEF